MENETKLSQVIWFGDLYIEERYGCDPSAKDFY